MEKYQGIRNYIKKLETKSKKLKKNFKLIIYSQKQLDILDKEVKDNVCKVVKENKVICKS